MKKLIFTLCILSGLMQFSRAFAQVEWYKSQEEAEDARFYTFLGESSDGYGMILTYPDQKFLAKLKYGLAVRYLGPQSKKLTSKELPDGLPPFLSLQSFHDYLVITGTGEKNNSDKGDAQILFLNREMEVVQKKSFSLEGNRHVWKSVYKFVTADSNYLITDFIAQCIPDAPSTKPDPMIHHITVFDRNLELAWEGDIDFNNLFGGKHVLQSLELGFTQRKELVVVSLVAIQLNYYYTAHLIGSGNSKAQELFRKEEPSSSCFNSQALITADDEIVILNLKGGIGKTISLSFFYKSIDSDEPEIVKIHETDKDFMNKYPALKAGTKVLPVVNVAFKHDNGIIAVGETVDPDYNISGRIVITKYSMTGEIEWMQVIDRNISIPYQSMRTSFAVFEDKDEILLFYLDDPESVTGKVPSKFVRLEGNGILLARISNSGSMIEKKLLSSKKETGVTGLLPKCYRASVNTYFIAGRNDKYLNFGIYEMK